MYLIIQIGQYNRWCKQCVGNGLDRSEKYLKFIVIKMVGNVGATIGRPQEVIKMVGNVGATIGRPQEA